MKHVIEIDDSTIAGRHIWGLVELLIRKAKGIELLSADTLFKGEKTLLKKTTSPNRKISDLRGKVSKLSSQEIDEQLNNLRNEWERDI